MADRRPRPTSSGTSPEKAPRKAAGKPAGKPSKAGRTPDPASGKKKSKQKSAPTTEPRAARRAATPAAAGPTQELTVSTLTTPEPPETAATTDTTDPDTTTTGATVQDAPEAMFTAERPAADRTLQEGTAEGDGGSMFGPGATPQAGRIPVLAVTPQVDGGRWPAKAVVGERVPSTATVFREGHDAVAATAVLVDPDGAVHQMVRMTPGAPGLDSWNASLTPD